MCNNSPPSVTLNGHSSLTKAFLAARDGSQAHFRNPAESPCGPFCAERTSLSSRSCPPRLHGHGSEHAAMPSRLTAIPPHRHPSSPATIPSQHHPSSLATISSHHHPSSPALPLDLTGSPRATCRSKIPKELQQSNFAQAQSLRDQARLIINKTMVASSLLIKASTPHATTGKRQSGDTAVETAHSH